MRWWHSFLQVFNGQRPFNFFLSSPLLTRTLIPATLLLAWCILLRRLALPSFSVWPPVLADLHMNYKEVLVWVFAAFWWGHSCANQHIIIHCDNLAVVYIIKSIKGVLPMLLLCMHLDSCFGFPQLTTLGSLLFMSRVTATPLWMHVSLTWT